MHLPFRLRLAKTLIASSIAIAARCAGAGTIAPDLQAIMQATSPSRRIPVVIRLQSQADVATPAATGATRLGCVQAVERALKDTATATQNTPAPGHPLGLLDELRAVANFAVRDIRPFWITNAIAVTATSPVIESCAAREDVEVITY